VIEFILNNQRILTEKAPGGSLLDFIRNDNQLFGTKIGCREGDCGACTVLEGSLTNSVLTYKTIVSCLTPLINVHGKHIVTVEGLNLDELSPVQNAMADNAATQCGFCTPGFVVSLSGYLLSTEKKDPIQSISGNICRCTGYKSIEKAALEVDDLKKSLKDGSIIESLLEEGCIPDYFAAIPEMLSKIKPHENQLLGDEILIGGGTDLMVQKAENIHSSKLESTQENIPDTVEIANSRIKIGAGINTNGFFTSPVLNSAFPQLKGFSRLIASEQIRNMGTLAGNIVNASPIGDLSILLLAMDADLILEKANDETRQLKLADFFLDYKKTEMNADEVIKFVVFDKLKEGQKINFEKVSKRTYLDIASVNTAISIVVKEGLIKNLSLSAGGIAPFPMYMAKTNDFLTGKKLDITTLGLALVILQQEIAPISDIRGSKKYKRLLIRQLFLQHFLVLFPDMFNNEQVHNLMTTNSNTL